MKEKEYPSLIYNTRRRATFDPQPTFFKKRLQETPSKLIDDFLSELSANENGTLWSTSLKIPYGDFDLSQEYLSVYPVLHQQFLDSLRGLIPLVTVTPYNEFLGTIRQHESEEWHTLRHLFITASVSKVAYNLTPRGAKNYIASHLWGLNKMDEDDTPLAIEYGRQNENIARKLYEEEMKIRDPTASVLQMGLTQSKQYHELACSPDGVLESKVNPKRAIEIKCPIRLQKVHPKLFDQYLKGKKLDDFYLYRDAFGKIRLKNDHSYYYQIQMVLGILHLEQCDLIVWSPKGIITIPINFDKLFWSDLAEGLVSNHHSLLIPEYFLMRTPRNLDVLILDIV
ncbi:uncharacterized protein LOC127751008 [Frankliniella occidentalis]|uniref:Uncharacterized protein LOC127751008 n=1 Tax=Frankliniella occidentalis TaxID=133901 RepID=A0A9C6X5T4_FRAOC|nr:uncharacterized protein LOC127751008 [Frankliniella occidentalis]